MSQFPSFATFFKSFLLLLFLSIPRGQLAMVGGLVWGPQMLFG